MISKLTSLASSRFLRSVATVLALGSTAVTLGACGDDVGSSEQNATDSFINPTEHGELLFGVPHDASFDEAHRFHSWTFTLTGEADIELATKINTPNLDTVMYLYRLEPGADSWGHYIAKNDDNGGLASLISGSWGAGQYRIKIKASKIYMQGHFSLTGQCDGPGCPLPPGGECSPDDPAVLPTTTGFGPTCAATLQAVLLDPAASMYSANTTYEERCSHGAIVGKAIDYYHDYWDDQMGWEEFTYGEEITMDAHVSLHQGGGSVVSVSTAWGDEDGMSFVFAPDGQLLVHFQDAQSSSTGWYCREPDEAELPEPDMDCVGRTIYYGPHQAEEIHHVEGTTSMADDEPFVDHYWYLPALQNFLQTYGLAEAEVVTYAADYWGERYGDNHGSQLELSAAGFSAVYYLGDEDYGNSTHLFTRTDESGTAFVCQSGAY